MLIRSKKSYCYFANRRKDGDCYPICSFRMPNRFIFEFRVLGGTPNNCAAPHSPAILPLQYLSVFRMNSRSFSLMVFTTKASLEEGEGECCFGKGRCICLIVSPEACKMLRSIKCSSSRILPGQLYCIKSCKALLLRALIFLPAFLANR